jgi:Rhodanese-like domain
MTRWFTLLITLTIVFVLACDHAPPVAIERAATPTPAPRANVDPDHPMIEAPRISLEDAKKDYDAKTAVFIDTHGIAQYDSEHITGAINIPANELNKYFDKIPKGKKLIVYCS